MSEHTQNNLNLLITDNNGKILVKLDDCLSIHTIVNHKHGIAIGHTLPSDEIDKMSEMLLYFQVAKVHNKQLRKDKSLRKAAKRFKYRERVYTAMLKDTVVVKTEGFEQPFKEFNK